MNPVRPDRGAAITSRHGSAEPDDAGSGKRQYDEEPGLLDDIADRVGFRARIESNPALKQTYRIGVGVVGTVVLVAGVVMIPFPGPGWLVVIAGLAILATEFAWAERLLDFTKAKVLGWTRWVNSQAIWIRVLIGLATAAFVYGVIVVVLHVTGVPSWVPRWIPLWR
ncbi:TIGR02611 family protein [Cumulibacter manganitolerans]|uniref:TIGR02611 family protein n=1 Tax=Cumulibacter manganitolerans TaxID=1884992 RepID=UPI001E53DF9C|nr:TIGR02611 family protein [Cumulibacter manganitolerans]